MHQRLITTIIKFTIFNLRTLKYMVGSIKLVVLLHVNSAINFILVDKALSDVNQAGSILIMVKVPKHQHYFLITHSKISMVQ